jgi:uncharacterized protein (DUF4415 family)
MSKLTELIKNQAVEPAEGQEAEIDFSDIPATTEADWVGAVRGRFYRAGKPRLNIELDEDISEWLMHQGGDYQEWVNAALRNAMREEGQAPEKA